MTHHLQPVCALRMSHMAGDGCYKGRRGNLYVNTVRQSRRTGPPLTAERDSVLLARLPGNYDVTGEQHDGGRGRDHHGCYEKMQLQELCTAKCTRWQREHDVIVAPHTGESTEDYQLNLQLPSDSQLYIYFCGCSQHHLCLVLSSGWELLETHCTTCSSTGKHT